jgi:hypothetical protein
MKRIRLRTFGLRKRDVILTLEGGGRFHIEPVPEAIDDFPKRKIASLTSVVGPNDFGPEQTLEKNRIRIRPPKIGGSGIRILLSVKCSTHFLQQEFFANNGL